MVLPVDQAPPPRARDEPLVEAVQRSTRCGGPIDRRVLEKHDRERGKTARAYLSTGGPTTMRCASRNEGPQDLAGWRSHSSFRKIGPLLK